MKKIKQQKKRGISLIVLVITIIVMIILAAAIILSLDGSDIIERAKNATSSNDVATAKEIVALAKSEWSFERQEGYDTFREYAEAKLEEADFDMNNIYVEDSGRVLFDTAARFAKAGVEIGTEVTGYTLNSTTSYTTSGKENTYSSANGIPTTLTRDTAIKWTYIGADEEGNAMLVGSVTSTTPKIKLGGKGAYLNGPEELDAACEAMYSSNKGTARSINIDDVIRVLEYTGEAGGYFDEDFSYIPTKNLKTIGQIAKEIGYDITKLGSGVPEDGKELSTYKANYILIDRADDAAKYNTLRADLIYPKDIKETYFLATSCAAVDFDSEYVGFDMFAVDRVSVDSFGAFFSDGSVNCHEKAIRPVVVLNSDVEVIYNGTVATIK